jgi:serine/threonine protein kinase
MHDSKDSFQTIGRVGAYELVDTIARGGFATVFRARQPALNRLVALKRLELPQAHATLRERFVREARLAGSLEHPNVVSVFDFFEHDRVPYIAMELMPKGSLRPWVGRLNGRQVFGALDAVLAGLAHAQEHGVAHRDLKPENLLLTKSGTVKIADFGIAKAYSQVTQQLTATGLAVGTPRYIAHRDPLWPLGRALRHHCLQG